MLLHVSAIPIACLVGFAVEEQQFTELTKLKKYFFKENVDIRENNHLAAFWKAVLGC